MTELESAISEALDSLRQGGIQRADNVLAGALDKYQQEQRALLGQAAPEAPPRPYEAVVLETLGVIDGLLGSPPALESLMRELAKSTIDKLGE
jgi:predicted O-methyltransferase YrrM